MKKLLYLLLLTLPAAAQTVDSTILNINFAAGLLSITTVGSTQHTFSPISAEALGVPSVPLSLTSTPSFLVTNLGNTQGWSVVLSTSHGSEHSFELDYQPGSGQVRRLSGLILPQDLDRDANFGGALATGRKVLSAPANTNQGFFTYSLATNQWSLLSPNQEIRSGQFTWTLQATLYANP